MNKSLVFFILIYLGVSNVFSQYQIIINSGNPNWPSPICPGSQVTLSLNGYASTSPSWYANGVFIGQSRSIQVNPTQSTTYTSNFASQGLTLNVLQIPSASNPIVGSLTVCKGQSSVTYNVPEITNATSYAWTLPMGVIGNSTTNRITVNYGTTAVSGNITVKGYNQCGFGSSSSLLVTVNSSPSPPSLAKDTIICEYQFLNLNVNSNEDVNYEWTGPNGFYSSLKNPLVSSSVNEQIAGTYSVQVVSNGCKSLSSSIEVKINKAKATVKNSICEGGKLELFASFIPGATYFWTGPNGFLSTLQNPVIDSVKSVKSSGTYMVYTTVNNCTSPVPGQISVNVQPIPEATGVTNNGPLCVGKILSLRTDSIPGATYLWTGPNGFTSTLRNPIVSTNFSTSMIGAYNLNVSLNGCTSQPLTSNVELNKTSASSLPVCVGGDFKLTASNVTGAVYNWTGPNGFTSSLQNPIVSSSATTVMTGVYSVKSIANGCESPISSIIVSVNQSVSLPTVTENVVYCQNIIASKLNATGTNLKWYTEKEGGNPQLEAPLPLTQNYGITSYFVTQTTVCESKRAEIKVRVVPSSKIFFEGLNAICSGTSKKLKAPVIEGLSFQWKKNGLTISGATDSTLIVNSGVMDKIVPSF